MHSQKSPNLLCSIIKHKELKIVNTSAPPKKDQQKITLLLSKGHFLKARELTNKLLKKYPNNINLHNLSAIALHKMQRNDEAKVILVKGVEICTTDQQKATLYNSLGQIIKQVDPDYSLFCHQKAVELNPLAEHLSNLAKAELSNGLGDDALIHAKSAVLKSPNYVNGWEALCYVLLELGRYTECLEYLEEIPPSSMKRMKMAVDAYIGLNDNEQAVVHLNRFASSEMLSDVQLEFCFNAYNILGLFDDANIFVKSRQPSSLGYRLLLNLKAKNIDKRYLQEIINDFGSYKIGVVLKRRIAFSIADYYKKSDRIIWLNWLQRANAITPIGYEYSEAEILEDFEKATKFPYQTISTSTNQSSAPIFIIGMPRSGTTLTESILGAHSECLARGESTILGSILTKGSKRIGQGRQFTFMQTMQCADLNDMNSKANEYLKKLRPKGNQTSRLVDKMPHNFVYTAIIPKLFPNAKIIHIKRNPIANILSIFEQDFTSFHSYASSIDTIIRYYQKYQTYMQKMQTLVPEGQLFELSYDELVSAPETQVRSLLEFCDLPFEQSCMKFEEQTRTVRTSSRHQVRQGFYTSSLKPWEGLEEQLVDLLKAFPDAC
jgi:tetratricopeptide (TPR) repeat protein